MPPCGWGVKAYLSVLKRRSLQRYINSSVYFFLLDVTSSPIYRDANWEKEVSRRTCPRFSGGGISGKMCGVWNIWIPIADYKYLRVAVDF